MHTLLVEVPTGKKRKPAIFYMNMAYRFTLKVIYRSQTYIMVVFLLCFFLLIFIIYTLYLLD